jgi:Glycosyltransferase 61
MMIMRIEQRKWMAPFVLFSTSVVVIMQISYDHGRLTPFSAISKSIVTTIVGDEIFLPSSTSAVVSTTTTDEEENDDERHHVITDDDSDDWFNETKWTSDPSTAKCFYVENVCSSAQRLFYYPNPASNNKNNDDDNDGDTQSLRRYHQPYPIRLRLRWKITPEHVETKAIPPGYPSYVDIEKMSYLHHDDDNGDKTKTISSSSTATSSQPHRRSLIDGCSFSPIHNHMSLFSFSDHMLGEFYSRVFMGLFDIFEMVTATTATNTNDKGEEGDEDNNTNDDENEDDNEKIPATLNSTDHTSTTTNTAATMLMKQKFRSHTQIYLQMDMGKSELLDSQKLLLGIFSSNPPLHFKTILDNPTCTCMKRLILCGYDTKASAPTVKNNNFGNTTTMTTVTPARFVGSSAGGKQRRKKTKDTNGKNERVRQYILDRLVRDNDQYIQNRIQDGRWKRIMSVLQQMSFFQHNKTLLGQSASQNHLDDWKVVGLAQRVGRRRWSNLDQLIRACNKHFIDQKTVCVEVNIEKDEFSNSIQHLLSHAGLDALVGIHGAQLTEALLMPSDAVVVELLPWIHQSIKWGSWAKWAHRPTPLGALFSETSLNHVGYPLKRQSAPNVCQNAAFTQKCWEKQNNSWQNRDFVVDEKTLLDVVQKFVVSDHPASCEEWQNIAGGDYVLYNINCAEESQSDMNSREEEMKKVHHFYRDEQWVKEKTAWSLQNETGDTKPPRVSIVNTAGEK